MKNLHTLLFSIIFLASSVSRAGQPQILNRDTTIQIISSGKPYTNAWTGGMNAPCFADMDLNGDGKMDIIVFDWIGGNDFRLNCFLNTGRTSGAIWVEAPQYKKVFPQTLEGWIRTFDYDCDGDLDLFSYFISGGLQIYRNDFSSGTGLRFTTVPGVLNTHYSSFSTPAFVTRVDMPTLSDIDNDGDMDMLGFSNASYFLEHNKSLSQETIGNCGSLTNYYNVVGCWGYFETDPSVNAVRLPSQPPVNTGNSCSFYSANPFRMSPEESILNYRNLHNGSAILALDMDGDGDKDILLGDIGGPNLLYVENCGTPDSAFACFADNTFPSYDVPATFPSNFPAAYYFDTNNDSKKDLVVSNFLRTGEDFHNVWLYKNISTTNANVFSYETNRFLVNTMIDVGSCAKPTFCDLSGDGLDDLIIGNDFYVGTLKSQLAYYKNTGTSAKAKYELVTDDLAGLSSVSSVKAFHPAFGDIDGDGDFDLIVGEENGTLIYYQNIGSATAPNFIQSQTNYQSINVTANAAPQLIDVDRDGKLDLLVGRRSGKIYYYHNTGSVNIPVFTFVSNSFGGVNVSAGSSTGFSVPCLHDVNGSYELIVGSESGYLYHYTNIDGNLAGSFTLNDSLFQNIYEPARAVPAVTDVDGDGKYDLVVGNSMGGIVLFSQNPLLSSVKEVQQNSFFSFYPNPTSDQLNIVMDNIQSGGRVVVEVSDILGKIIFRKESTSRQFALDVKNLNSGTYLCRISDGQRSFSQKFVKQ